MAESCAVCGASFGSAADLVVHAREEHRDGSPSDTGPAPAPSPYACALCGARFAQPELLREHNLRPHRAPARPGRTFPSPGRPSPA